MKKVYIKPDSRTLALEVHNSLLDLFSRPYADSRQRDDRFEDHEDYDEDPNDFDDVAFWDD